MPPETPADPGLDPDDLATTLRVLAQLHELDQEHPDYVTVRRATSHMFKASKQARRRALRQEVLDADGAWVRLRNWGTPETSPSLVVQRGLPAELERRLEGSVLEEGAPQWQVGWPQPGCVRVPVRAGDELMGELGVFRQSSWNFFACDCCG